MFGSWICSMTMNRKFITKIPNTKPWKCQMMYQGSLCVNFQIFSPLNSEIEWIYRNISVENHFISTEQNSERIKWKLHSWPSHFILNQQGIEKNRLIYFCFAWNRIGFGLNWISRTFSQIGYIDHRHSMVNSLESCQTENVSPNFK